MVSEGTLSIIARASPKQLLANLSAGEVWRFPQFRLCVCVAAVAALAAARGMELAHGCLVKKSTETAPSRAPRTRAP